MTIPAPRTSKRFQRAAESERDGLLAHRRRLAAEQERLQDELDQIAEALATTDDQLLTLGRMLGDPDPAGEHAAGLTLADDDRATDARLISGPQVRETAVAVLVRQPRHVEAIHYREWYELLVDAGYAISGKDPRAVFLTQISRSPVVRKASAPGMYELDRQAPLRLRQRYERLQSALRELSNANPDPDSLVAAGARRRELTAEIGQTERALDEALRVLGSQPGEPLRLSA